MTPDEQKAFDYVYAERDALRARIEVMEKAVEWACKFDVGRSRWRMSSWDSNELRRRAKEG